MRIIEAAPGKRIDLGREGENNAAQVVFDISDWVSEYGAGTAQLLAQRARDKSPYPVAMSTRTAADGDEEGGGSSATEAVWVVSKVDTAYPGSGKCELQYYVDGAIIKSSAYETYVADALGENDAPEEAWMSKVLSAAASVEESAEEARRYALDAQTAAEDAAASASAAGDFEVGNGLKKENGVLSVDMAAEVSADNTLPISSGLVYAEIGNIEVLLSAI